MKLRKILCICGLSGILSLGAVVGIHTNDTKPANAEGGQLIYCRMNYGWWTTAEATVGVHYWGGSKSTTWPGVRMNPVEGMACTWSYEIPADATNVIFTRLNPSGAVEDWGAKTKDLDAPEGDNILFNITSSSAVWGDPGCVGEWLAEPEIPEYHLLGTFNDWNDDGDEYLLTIDDKDSNHFTIKGVQLEADAELKACDVPNNFWYGTQGENIVVYEAGTYDIDLYVRADDDEHIVLTQCVVEPIYSVHYSGNEFVFALDEDGKPEGVKHQYSATIEQVARATELEFYKDSTKIDSNIGVDCDPSTFEPIPGNNIVGDVTDGFRVYHGQPSMKIYLKTYEDGGMSLWGAGYGVNEFKAGLLSSTPALVKDEEFVPDDTYFEQYKTNTDIKLAAKEGTGPDNSYTIDCDAVSEVIGIESAGDNNAKQAYNNCSWTVYNDATATIYVKVKKADLSLWIYVGGRAHTWTATIGGAEISLPNHNENNEYYGSFNAVAGQELTKICKDGQELSFTVKQMGNNNLDADKKVIVSGLQTLYFDEVNSTVFLSGLTFGGYHIIKNARTADATFVQMTKGDDFEGFIQYYSNSVEFAKGDTIDFVDTSSSSSLAVVFKILKINEGGLKENFEIADEKLQCKVACTSMVYMKLKSGEDEVYFGDVPEPVAKAIEFANAFVSEVTVSCSADEKSRAAAVKATWDAKATAYKALDQNVKNCLKDGSASSVLEIRDYAAKYTAIYNKRGTDYNLENFMEWNLVKDNAPTTSTLDSFNADLTIIIIVVTAVIGITMIISLERKRIHK